MIRLLCLASILTLLGGCRGTLGSEAPGRSADHSECRVDRANPTDLFQGPDGPLASTFLPFGMKIDGTRSSTREQADLQQLPCGVTVVAFHAAVLDESDGPLPTPEEMAGQADQLLKDSDLSVERVDHGVEEDAILYYLSGVQGTRQVEGVLAIIGDSVSPRRVALVFLAPADEYDRAEPAFEESATLLSFAPARSAASAE